MNALTPPPLRTRGTLTCVVAAACLSGCADASNSPLAVVLTEETHAALAVHSGLPSLPELTTRTELDSEAAGSVDLWMDSWDREADEGRALRRESYALAAQPLAEALGRDGVRAVVDEVGRVLGAVSALEPASLPDRLDLEHGRMVALHRSALQALDDGSVGAALSRALEAADALREVGPQAVARVLLNRADQQLQAIVADADARPAGPGEVDLERAERLVHGARIALKDEDWTRAVQRAYYACQLLGVAPY